ncbi:hypothetical protein ACLOJK_001402 [Asimina triloba]
MGMRWSKISTDSFLAVAPSLQQISRHRLRHRHRHRHRYAVRIAPQHTAHPPSCPRVILANALVESVGESTCAIPLQTPPLPCLHGHPQGHLFPSPIVYPPLKFCILKSWKPNSAPFPLPDPSHSCTRLCYIIRRPRPYSLSLASRARRQDYRQVRRRRSGRASVAGHRCCHRCPVRRRAAADIDGAGSFGPFITAGSGSRAALGGEHGADDCYGWDGRVSSRDESVEHWIAHHREYFRFRYLSDHAVPVGRATLGGIMNVLGEPIDEKETDHCLHIHREAPAFVEQATEQQIFVIGIKVVDLLAPYQRGGKNGLFGGAGVVKTMLIMELINNSFGALMFGLRVCDIPSNVVSSGGFSVFAGVGAPVKAESKCALVYGQMNEPPGARACVGLTGLTVAENFRDAEGEDVLLFIDNIFRFTQANSEVSALLGCIPSAVGYQPTLATDLGGLQERITTKKGSITSVPAIYVPADDLTDPAPATTFAHLDEKCTMMLPVEYIKFFQTKNLEDIIAILGMDGLIEDDKLTVTRARKIQRFLSQPLHVAEVFTGAAGKNVELKESIASF